MKATIIFTSLFAAFAAATPLDLEARQGSVRVLLANDATDTAVQADIPRNGASVSIRANFGNLGNPVTANRGNIVSGGGSCRVFRDAGATQQVGATLNANGNSVSFGGNVNLNNGVIVCQ
ncbi:hypothetical protein K505DRAFT_379207 [Melanomma pulvis-pyrius CBS 109.77]|uniref:Uncharacterized protein n=1 Tax=Melanomma pulvis-pyrius CBS 109.77 TaxID=1314802 RepID=A0A6A6WV77_9PLEO|nr:hypothetical protein K505DRAFT_379207 [Melanomma pulvis-pyrius CBS 109.77]